MMTENTLIKEVMMSIEQLKIIEDFILWLNNEGRSKNTIRVYIAAVKKLIKWYEETEDHPFSPEKVTTLHIREFEEYMIKYEKLKPTTINKIIASLKTFYKYCISTSIVNYDPMGKIKMKRISTQYAAPRWICRQDNAKFFHAIEQIQKEKIKYRNLAICRLMASAGLRVQEVADLNIEDISLENRREDVIVRSGKGNKYRIVPLNSDAIEALKKWLKYREYNSLQEPLFISNRGSRINTRLIHRIVQRYSEKACIDKISPHVLRHTFCKSLVDQGVGLERVAYLAGHEDLETTRRYTKPSQQDLRRAVQSISEKR